MPRISSTVRQRFFALCPPAPTYARDFMEDGLHALANVSADPQAVLELLVLARDEKAQHDRGLWAQRQTQRPGDVDRLTLTSYPGRPPLVRCERDGGSGFGDGHGRAGVDSFGGLV